MLTLSVSLLFYTVAAHDCWRFARRDKPRLSVVDFFAGGVLAVWSLAILVALITTTDWINHDFKIHPAPAAALLFVVMRHAFDWQAKTLKNEV